MWQAVLFRSLQLCQVMFVSRGCSDGWRCFAYRNQQCCMMDDSRRWCRPLCLKKLVVHACSMWTNTTDRQATPRPEIKHPAQKWCVAIPTPLLPGFSSNLSPTSSSVRSSKSLNGCPIPERQLGEVLGSLSVPRNPSVLVGGVTTQSRGGGRGGREAGKGADLVDFDANGHQWGGGWR